MCVATLEDNDERKQSAILKLRSDCSFIEIVIANFQLNEITFAAPITNSDFNFHKFCICPKQFVAFGNNWGISDVILGAEVQY